MRKPFFKNFPPRRRLSARAAGKFPAAKKERGGAPKGAPPASGYKFKKNQKEMRRQNGRGSSVWRVRRGQPSVCSAANSFASRAASRSSAPFSLRRPSCAHHKSRASSARPVCSAGKMPRSASPRTASCFKVKGTPSARIFSSIPPPLDEGRAGGEVVFAAGVVRLF